MYIIYIKAKLQDETAGEVGVEDDDSDEHSLLTACLGLIG